MVRDMDAGVHTDWWCPILMMLYRPFYELGFGIGFILLGQVSGFISVGALIRPLSSGSGLRLRPPSGYACSLLVTPC